MASQEAPGETGPTTLILLCAKVQVSVNVGNKVREMRANTQRRAGHFWEDSSIQILYAFGVTERLCSASGHES